MRLSELKNRINLANYFEDLKVVVAINLPYPTVGVTPHVNVSNIRVGFDWDKGLAILSTETPVSLLDSEIVDKFRKLSSSHSLLHYENSNLKKEINRLRDKMTEIQFCILIGAIFLAPHYERPVGLMIGLIALTLGIGNGLLEVLT